MTAPTLPPHEILDVHGMAARLGVPVRRVQDLLTAGRIRGAQRLGEAQRGLWAVAVPQGGPVDVAPARKRGRPRKS